MAVPPQMADASPSIAVVGSGPSGCYAAQFLRKAWPKAEIAVFERLPVPYGLIRYGVAPDHQGTKAVQQQFDRLFTRDSVQFIGNVEVGSKLSLADLRSAFDIVVLATGMTGDRGLDIPGHDLAGVHGAGRITRILNEHPLEPSSDVSLGSRLVVVGNGNVAVDIIRLLLKPDSAFRGSDLNLAVRHAILEHPVTRIDVVGRSPLHRAKFDAAVISELSQIPNVRYSLAEGVDAAADGDARVLALLALVNGEANHAVQGSEGCPMVRFHFGWTPEAVVKSARHLEFIARSSSEPDETLELEADSIITAIGFQEHPTADLRASDLVEDRAGDSGRLAQGLYGVGWCAEGPTLNIPANRATTRTTVQTIVEDVASGRVRVAKGGLGVLPPGSLSESTDYDAWLLIDMEERRRAPSSKARCKIQQIDEMLQIAATRHH